MVISQELNSSTTSSQTGRISFALLDRGTITNISYQRRMMMGSSSTVGGSNSWRMLKLTASILSILFVMMILWSNGGSNDNDIDSTATTMPRQLSSLQQFMDPKSTNLRSEIVGGVIPPASVYIDQDTSTRNGVGQFKYLPKGKWIKGRSSEHAAPICCGWDDGHYLKVPECGTVPMPRVNGGKIYDIYT